MTTPAPNAVDSLAHLLRERPCVVLSGAGARAEMGEALRQFFGAAVPS